MSFTKLSDSDKQTLLEVAQQSIKYGSSHHRALPIELNHYNSLLNEAGASFVTLNLHQQLRGCIGTLDAYQPLVKDVAEHAFAAAYKDPRFSPVNNNEIDNLEIHVSVLTKSTPIDFKDEKDLLQKLKPGTDGIILQENYNKGTFLPSVWEQLPEPEDFLNHLKIKAGFSKDYWSNNLEAYRYTTISF